MEIGSSYAINSLWDLTSTGKIDPASSRTYRTVERQTTYSGDSIEISDEAKQLYSEMIHKYDKAASQKGGEKAGQEGARSEGAGGAGGSSDSSSSVEALKKQLQSLKSQLAALAAQAGNGGDAGVMGKMNALQSQIAALEAQLNEAQAAA